jgi:hypothetical protein
VIINNVKVVTMPNIHPEVLDILTVCRKFMTRTMSESDYKEKEIFIRFTQSIICYRTSDYTLPLCEQLPTGIWRFNFLVGHQIPWNKYDTGFAILPTTLIFAKFYRGKFSWHDWISSLHPDITFRHNDAFYEGKKFCGTDIATIDDWTFAKCGIQLTPLDKEELDRVMTGDRMWKPEHVNAITGIPGVILNDE